jgi:hypothetical protein
MTTLAKRLRIRLEKTAMVVETSEVMGWWRCA